MTLLFLGEVAERLRVDYWTAYGFVQSGKIPSIRLGGRRRIQVSEDDLNAFIEASRVGPEPGPIAETIVANRPKNGGAKKTSSDAPHQWRQRFARKA